MIPYTEFGKLRLSQFLPAVQVAELDNWEFEGHLWIGEASGFSEWLRLQSDPLVLRSLAIDFMDFPAEVAAKVLAMIDLPVRPGMTVEQTDALFGEHNRTFRFTADRATYCYRTRDAEPYSVSCTVLDNGGLTYLVIMVPMHGHYHGD
jgi:hypothetical protein